MAHHWIKDKALLFFDYRVNEALHMTDEEHDIFVSLMQQIRNELQNKHDEFQNAIIVGYIELVLNFVSVFITVSLLPEHWKTRISS